MPTSKVLQHLIEEPAEVVGFFGSTHEYQRDKPGRLKEQVVESKGSKIGRAGTVQELNKLEAEIGVQRRRQDPWEKAMLYQRRVKLFVHSGLSKEPLILFTLQSSFAIAKCL